jgi:hypothetical protein
MTVAQEVLRYAREYAGNTFDEIPTEMRSRVREIIVDYIEYETGLRERWRSPRPRLDSTLFDEFGVLKLDWRLIAQTELGECALQGYIASQPSGAIVGRMEAYEGACPACREISGRRFTVVMPDAPNKDWAMQVWRGKSWVHPAMAEPATVGDWPYAGLQHPGCRGSWAIISKTPANVSPAFARQLDEAIARALPSNQ